MFGKKPEEEAVEPADLGLQVLVRIASTLDGIRADMADLKAKVDVIHEVYESINQPK